MERFREESLVNLKMHVEEIVAGIRHDDKANRDTLYDICRAKLEELVVSSKDSVSRIAAEDAVITVDTIEEWSSGILSMNQKCGMVDEDFSTTMADYEKSMLRFDSEIERLNRTHIDVMRDYYNRCIGIYLEKRARSDDMHLERAQRTLTHMIKCLKFKLDSATDIDEMKSFVALALTRIDAYADKFLSLVLAGNDDIVETLRKMKLPDCAAELVYC